MAQQTPNYKLSKPDANDPFGDFRQLFNDNMDKIDQIGGGSGGHTIVDENGADMPAEGKLQFTGNVTVSDDSINGKTVVNVTGGGGSANIVELTQAEYDALPDSKFTDDTVYLIKDAISASDAELTHVNGFFIDTDNVITTGTYVGSFTYTATEDCIGVIGVVSDSSHEAIIRVDGKTYSSLYNTGVSSVYNNMSVFLRKGQMLTVTQGNSAWSVSYAIYGVKQGSNVTIIPDYASACYSTTEREVGCFVDGKPLYQRTIYIPSLPNATEVSFPHNISDLDKVVEIFGVAYNSSNYSIPITFANPASVAQVTAYTSPTDIYIGTGMDRTSFVGYITLRYTKTTDVAGSGDWTPLGKPTVHYSTDEQVIGTWIDGKPVYEITVEVNSVNHNDWTDVFSLADADIKGYDSRTSYAQLNNGERVQLDWFVTTSIYNRSIITNSGTKFRVETQGNNYSKIVATIQYTKTTD